jgi:hypothetical protein
MSFLDEFEEDITRNHQLIHELKKLLHILELQAAKFGIQVPLSLAVDISEMTTRIASLEDNLSKLENTKQSRMLLMQEQISVKEKLQEIQKDIERKYIYKLIGDKKDLIATQEQQKVRIETILNSSSFELAFRQYTTDLKEENTSIYAGLFKQIYLSLNPVNSIMGRLIKAQVNETKARKALRDQLASLDGVILYLRQEIAELEKQI